MKVWQGNYSNNTVRRLALGAAFVALFTTISLLAAGVSLAIEVDAGDCGLVVTTADEYVDVSNLNPGDGKASHLIATNTKETPLRYYFTMEKVGSTAGVYPGLTGKHLNEALHITVRQDGNTIFSGLVDDFTEKDMGILNGFQSQRIDILVNLDGRVVGNEYQSASVTIRFKFRAECGGGSMLEVRKFRDGNRNGIWDEGEPEISNWRVFVDGREYRTPLFLSVEPGVYIVSEETRSGWLPSTATSQTVTVGQRDRRLVLFGNYPEGSSPDGNSLVVRKFNDLNGDGAWNSGEPEIGGWPVTINGRQYATPVLLYDLPAGEYRVEEESRPGWTATTETSVIVALQSTGRQTVLFGNRQVPQENGGTRLTVRKFFDVNANGIWDEGEMEILDWPVSVNGQDYLTPITLQVDPGSYTVSEEVRAEEGWNPTTPTPVIRELAEGDDVTVIFGNYNEQELIIDPEAPLLTDEMPQTSEFPPFYYYAAGTLLFMAGFAFNLKTRRIKGRL